MARGIGGKNLKNMEIGTIAALKKHWGINGIVSFKSESEIRKILKIQKFILAADFIRFFQHFDGMKEQDGEGFLFYNVENLMDMKEKFNLREMDPLNNIIIFADYMLESWWYGVEVYSNGAYEIGIISSSANFKKISSSLDEFIQLYLTDSPTLYEYQ